MAVHVGRSSPQDIARHSRELFVIVRLLASAVWVDLGIPCQIDTAVAHVDVPFAIMHVTCKEAAGVLVGSKTTCTPLAQLLALVFRVTASFLQIANVAVIARKTTTTP